MSNSFKNNKSMEKILTPEVLRANDFALRIYDSYRKTLDIIERTNYALGRKPVFKVNIGSTLNCKVNINANSSTATQKI